MNRNLFKKLGLATTVLLASTASQAAIDVSGITTKLGEGEAAVAAIGAAILVVWAISKVYKMIKS